MNIIALPDKQWAIYKEDIMKQALIIAASL